MGWETLNISWKTIYIWAEYPLYGRRGPQLLVDDPQYGLNGHYKVPDWPSARDKCVSYGLNDRYWQDDPLWYVLNDSTLAKWPSIWVRWRLTSAERSSLWAGMTLHTNWMTICIGLITPWSNDPLYYGFLENGFFKFQLNSQIQQLGQHLGGFLFIFIATWSFVNYSLHHIIVMKMCSLTNFKAWSKMLKLLNNSRKTFLKWFLGWMTLKAKSPSTLAEWCYVRTEWPYGGR